MGTDRNRRSESLKKRLKKDKEDTEKKGSKKEVVKDRPSVLMYLPKDLYIELDASFDEINAKCKREKGERLQKNRDFYPAVIRAGLQGKAVEEILDL